MYVIPLSPHNLPWSRSSSPQSVARGSSEFKSRTHCYWQKVSELGLYLSPSTRSCQSSVAHPDFRKFRLPVGQYPSHPPYPEGQHDLVKNPFLSNSARIRSICGECCLALIFSYHCAEYEFSLSDLVGLGYRYRALFQKVVKSRKFSLLPLKLVPPLGCVKNTTDAFFWWCCVSN